MKRLDGCGMLVFCAENRVFMRSVLFAKINKINKIPNADVAELV